MDYKSKIIQLRICTDVLVSSEDRLLKKDSELRGMVNGLLLALSILKGDIYVPIEYFEVEGNK